MAVLMHIVEHHILVEEGVECIMEDIIDLVLLIKINEYIEIPKYTVVLG